MSNLAAAGDKKVLVLIDGKSVFYRGYYAMPNLTTKDGTPTGGVYGFAVIALELIRQIAPDYVAVAWDKPKTNIRRRLQIYPEYKAGRVTPPADFYQQIPILKSLLAAFGWPFYELDDYEADDIIGTLSSQANAQDIYTVIISSDLDMLQLVDNDTALFALKKGLANLEQVDRAAFEQKYGIKVEQFLDLKSLKGDASDNIPGVPGVGEKTGLKLLQKYDTLDGVYENVAQESPALREKLLSGKASAYMSQALARIMCDAPLQLDLKAMAMSNLNRAQLRQQLLDLEFTSLLNRLPADYQESAAELTAAADTIQLVVPTDLKLGDPVVAQVVDGQLYISSDVKTAAAVTFTQAAALLDSKSVVTHDAKLLAEQFLARELDVTWRVAFDTKHAAFLLNSLNSPKTLDELTSLQYGCATSVMQLGYLWQLYHEEAEALHQVPKLDQLAQYIDFPLQIVLAKIEKRGMLINSDQLTLMSHNMQQQLDDIRGQVFQQVGCEFNLASPKQLSTILFDRLHLTPTGKRNKQGNYSTGVKVLDRLAKTNPVVQLIQQYRSISKLKSTYADALAAATDLTGRIHTTFSQDVVSTGRLSSSNPNLQNIPTRTPQGKQIKQCFVAPAGRVIVNADYAQFELRLAAALAGDQKMIAMFSDPKNDIHAMTAAEAYGIPLDQVTSEQRRHAKTINFGVLYGMSPKGLADATGMSMTAAAKFIARYFEIRQPIRAYLDKILAQAETDGYVETWCGRRRPTPDVKSSNFVVREAAKRAAANMPIQGTEADLMKQAMLKIEAEVKNAVQIMQVHDSIMLECDEAAAPAVAAQVKSIMEHIAPDLGVRLLVDVSYGPSWGEL